ncbi:hypothetical protein C8F04DRAFT_1213330 [Mycena alexandri]|uniref:T6SS Phospholipase effector Tle1-like catalytic domain-containing protein n=1 Tax=Mycena alexandri TaxID=1745969 RepID=A0AAD6SAM7_9AGAR|nr:hypothetical protein C8F04DRAFT_1213330 [Mycena alexandri]
MFCDGTGQDGMIGTNAPTCSDDQTKFDDRMRQIVFYQSGVGSEANFTGEMHQTSWYIPSKIRDAYAFLAQNFEAGDEILLFGGAYTVRKLAQLIDKIGLLETENLGLFYQIWRELVDGKPPTIPEKTRVTTIKCLGVWDTVGVKDEPAALHIADTIVPSNVERALHAVSLQENRAEFSPTLFTLPSRSNQILKEGCSAYWFPGSNLGVGGSYEHHELADIALFWMAGEILNDSLFDFDEKFLLRSKQPAPRAPWGASIPHNAWNDTFMLWKNYSWVFTQQTRLESGDITATAQFHHSWVYAPNDIPHDHMITREILEKEFGHLTYQPLNDWENERRLNWNSETVRATSSTNPISLILASE